LNFLPIYFSKSPSIQGQAEANLNLA